MRGININVSKPLYIYPIGMDGKPVTNYSEITINTSSLPSTITNGDKCIMQNGQIVGLSIPKGAKQSGFLGSPMSTGGTFSIIQIKKIYTISDTQKYIEYFTLYTNN